MTIVASIHRTLVESVFEEWTAKRGIGPLDDLQRENVLSAIFLSKEYTRSRFLRPREILLPWYFDRWALIPALQDLKEKGPRDPDYGICSQINEPGIFELVMLVTGCPTGCPIEGDYFTYKDNKQKWEGKWLQKRHALIDQLIAALTP